MIAVLIFVMCTLVANADDINWQGNWAFSCDFDGNNLKNVPSQGKDCGGLCANTPGCTHFTWTPFNGGTCWMKQGQVSKSDADYSNVKDIVCGVVVVDNSNSNGIVWIDNWASSCDFKNNDLTNKLGKGENCNDFCLNTPGCTHYSWTSYNGGTCWLKQGSVSKSDAVKIDQENTICGLLKGGSTNIQSVPATRHGARESGACSLPEDNYAIQYPVALGNIDALGDLKFHPRLCGHVLNIDCGNGPLDIIITNSNLGGGLDLYGSTWQVATNGLPPGITQCDVQLTDKNAFVSDSPKCYYDTNETNNSYYRKLGILNTGGRLVESASIGSVIGQMADSAPYFAFYGFTNPDDTITFTFTDQTTLQIKVQDCKPGADKHMWE